jgi:hypothetical protein
MEVPRRNIELKARDPDPARSLQVSLDMGASDEGWLHQTDTYFRVPHGRLKLREEGAVAQLISYERSDETVARESRYRLVPVSDPAGSWRSAIATSFYAMTMIAGRRCRWEI